jgi:hypothetical protein
LAALPKHPLALPHFAPAATERGSAIKAKWKDDPAAAEKMNLPRPEALAKLNAQL